ncbi:MAG: DNA adenine methylase [Spirochaetales bacterium]|nr:DNA adenine methylase [Spirochaetales bacterium]
MTNLLSPMDLKDPYLTSQLIPYIGNKRRLIPFLHGVFQELLSGLKQPVFLDPFAGSGAVSRLAKIMGAAVYANDWEPYTEVLNGCYIGLNAEDLSALFHDRGGIDAVLAALNSDTGDFDPYISRYYAPADLETADYRLERLFYTPENAVRIDRMRCRIDQWYPAESPERTILLAALVLQAAVRSNTSGVFKACHKGFGGHGGDALGRIMKTLRLEKPHLAAGSSPCRVYRQDAATFAAGRPAALCYLDPPYNTHQYGSNYHLLNTIVLWDRPEVDDRRGTDGRYRAKAAIRQDWKKTRSAFCSRAAAAGAMEDLLNAVDARHIVISYNTEGIIPLEELYEMLSRRGEVELRTRDYVTYRGGRQSISRKTSNLEFLLVCRTGSGGGASAASLKSFMVRQRLFLLLKESFVPRRLLERFPRRGEDLILSGGLALPTRLFYRFIRVPPFRGLETLPLPEAEKTVRLLEEAVCRDREEEFAVLLEFLGDGLPPGDERFVRERILPVLRKFAHRKYRESFQRGAADLKHFLKEHPEDHTALREGLEALEALAKRRFEG